jgi:hypothetical protein
VVIVSISLDVTITKFVTAVRKQFVLLITINNNRNGRAMTQAVSRRPLTTEVRVRSRVSPCDICRGQSGTGTGFSPEYFGFPLSISFHRYSITWKNEKKNYHLSLHLHRSVVQWALRLQCVRTSAAGPFSTKRNRNAIWRLESDQFFQHSAST